MVSVVVMVMDEDSKYARPVAHLYKGQTFGMFLCKTSSTIQPDGVGERVRTCVTKPISFKHDLLRHIITFE